MGKSQTDQRTQVALEQPLPLTGIVIAGAEAHRIGRALASLRQLVAELIVVVNNDVTDATPEIAARFGAKVYLEPWKGFIGQKQSATQKATMRWILNLDADEELSPDLQQELRHLFGQPDRLTRYDAFSMPRLTQFAGRWIRHGDWYPDRQIRLWKRGAAVWSGKEPHAKLKVNGAIGKLRAPILHRPDDNIESLIAKTIRYSRHFIAECKCENRRVTLLDLLARPAWRFFRSYVLKAGFLDGWQGCAIAWLGSTYTFLRYAMVLLTQQDENANRKI